MSTTKILRDILDVERRVRELGLPRNKLLRVVENALLKAETATPDHPANSAGTFAYHEGIVTLRNEFYADGWIKDRPENIEVILRGDGEIMASFQNVDRACDDERHPQPRSGRKGAGTERVSSAAVQGELDLGDEAVLKKTPNLWFVMVDAQGAAELSLPVIEDGRFKYCIERVYLMQSNEKQNKIPTNDASEEDDRDPKTSQNKH